MEPERIKLLNDRPPDGAGRYVLYWMQAAQRAACNPALEHAIALADKRGLPVVVGFGLTDDYPEANLRHYRFMLEGLRETAAALEQRGIRFVLRRGQPAEIALALAPDATIVVCDRGYLRHQRAWRQRVAEGAGRQVIEVEGEVVVPVELASDKAEIGARTLRPRILRLREQFLQPLAGADAAGRRAHPGSALGSRPGDVDGTLASPQARPLRRAREPLCGRHRRGPRPACSGSWARSSPATGMPAATPRTAVPPSSALICSSARSRRSRWRWRRSRQRRRAMSTVPRSSRS